MFQFKMFLICVLSVLIFAARCIKCDCVINTNTITDDTPIILSTVTRDFPLLKNSPRGTLTVPNGSYLTLLCPNSHQHINFFKYFPRNNELLVQCAEGNTFFIKENNQTYMFDYLYCSRPLVPSILNTNVTCLAPRDSMDITLDNKHTTKLLVGYETNFDFLTVYEVCFDKRLIGPRYTLNTILPDIDKAQFKGLSAQWVNDRGLYLRVNLDSAYPCTTQASTFYKILSRNYFNDYARCCFYKTKVVQGQDFVYAAQQLATFTNVNTLPMCEQVNWNEVQNQIRLLAVSLNLPLNVWTGVYKVLNDVSGQTIIDRELYLHYRNDMDFAIPVPQFTWKVIYEPHTEQAVAIITLNDQKAARHGPDALLLCRDICSQLKWLNLPSRNDFQRGYTYCCELEDFKRGFNYRNNPFPKQIKGILTGPEKTTEQQTQ